MIMSKPAAALIAAATLTALATAVPAQATTRGSQGQAHAGRIVWTQVLDGAFTRHGSSRPVLMAAGCTS
jgi:hypothetical protein